MSTNQVAPFPPELRIKIYENLLSSNDGRDTYLNLRLVSRQTKREMDYEIVKDLKQRLRDLPSLGAIVTRLSPDPVTFPDTQRLHIRVQLSSDGPLAVQAILRGNLPIRELRIDLTNDEALIRKAPSFMTQAHFRRILYTQPARDMRDGIRYYFRKHFEQRYADPKVDRVLKVSMNLRKSTEVNPLPVLNHFRSYNFDDVHDGYRYEETTYQNGRYMGVVWEALRDEQQEEELPEGHSFHLLQSLPGCPTGLPIVEEDD
jgi:hypothetical protein